MMSGGPIERFTKGWAVRIRFGSHPTKAHYYVRDELSWANAACKAHSVKVAALRGLGNWKKCMKCEAALKRQMARCRRAGARLEDMTTPEWPANRNSGGNDDR